MKKAFLLMSFLITSSLLFASRKPKEATSGSNPPASAGGCSYNIDLKQTDFPEKVALYRANYWTSTDYDLESDLLKGNITEHSVWAEGPGVTTDYKGSCEYFYYYDDGLACFGEKGHSVDGGFTYTDASTEYWFSEQSVPTLKWDLGGVMSGAPSDLQNTELWGEEDLPFASLAEVEQMLLDKFQKWDLTMQTMERYTIQISPEQSCYLLMFTEQIDELPLMPYFYTKGYTKFNNWLLNCDASAYVSEDGIINMDCRDLVKTGEKLDTVKILSLEEAKAAWEEQIRSKGLEGVCVEDMGLYYIGMPIENQTAYQLTPFWFFCFSSENPLSASDAAAGSDGREVDYEFLNAVDGEWLQY